MDKTAQLEKIRHQLQQAGFKLTSQREATVAIILDHYQDHLSAEQVFMLTKSVAPEIGLATVYRTLEILTELHILNKGSFIEDGITHYDLCEPNQNSHFHHHLLCLQCGQIQEIHEDLLTDVEAEVLAKFQFAVLDHRLTLQGVCDHCQTVNVANGLPANKVDVTRQIDLSQL